MARYPDHIDQESAFRLPLPKREALDEEGKRQYDQIANPKAGTIKGLKGPAGIGLYSPLLSRVAQPVNRYLRFECGFTPRFRETAILTAAREVDSRFEWAAHEPEALKSGVPQAVVDAIKHKKGTDGLDAADALVITLGRELFRTRKLSQATFDQAMAAWGAKGLMETIALMGNYAGTAMLLAAFDMQLEPSDVVLPVP
jgi:4-carboxymuconolactone decarboxylase